MARLDIKAINFPLVKTLTLARVRAWRVLLFYVELFCYNKGNKGDRSEIQGDISETIAHDEF